MQTVAVFQMSLPTSPISFGKVPLHYHVALGRAVGHIVLPHLVGLWGSALPGNQSQKE